jgi:hypothetical protein
VLKDGLVAGLVFLVIAVICALIGRILLIGAAFSVSVWWGVGVLLPFGPLLFRLSYPDVAPLSRKFRLAVAPCVLLYVVLGPGSLSGLQHRAALLTSAHQSAAPANHYATEPAAKIKTENLDDRIAANARELDRLRAWCDQLLFKKRDLLASDAEGNLAYSIEATKYNEAVKKALAERDQLAALKK